jgi:Ca2+-binding EF-hand superfamily protein
MGLNYFNDEETEITLFTNIIENKIEESTIDLIIELKKTCDNILLDILKQKNPFKTSKEIDLIFKKKKNSFITHKDWKKILDTLFPEDNEILYNKIIEFINKSNLEEQKYIEFNIEKGYEYLMTREDKRNFLSNVNNSTVKYNIIYSHFIHLISIIQIELRKEYLGKISDIFIKYDNDSDGLLSENEFCEFMKELGISQFINKFLDKIDPYENNCINFSDIIDVLMEEHLPYENISLLDKILLI